MATKEGLRIKRAAKRSTACLRAHQAWPRKFRSHSMRWKWMSRSVLLRLPDRSVLSERQSTEANALLLGQVADRAANSLRLRKQPCRERTSERRRHIVF